MLRVFRSLEMDGSVGFLMMYRRRWREVERERGSSPCVIEVMTVDGFLEETDLFAM